MPMKTRIAALALAISFFAAPALGAIARAACGPCAMPSADTTPCTSLADGFVLWRGDARRAGERAPRCSEALRGRARCRLRRAGRRLRARAAHRARTSAAGFAASALRRPTTLILASTRSDPALIESRERRVSPALRGTSHARERDASGSRMAASSARDGLRPFRPLPGALRRLATRRIGRTRGGRRGSPVRGRRGPRPGRGDPRGPRAQPHGARIARGLARGARALPAGRRRSTIRGSATTCGRDRSVRTKSTRRTTSASPRRFRFPAKLALRGERAIAEAESAQSDLETQRVQLAALASRLFDEYWLAERALETNGQHAALLDDAHRVALSRYAAGSGSQQDVLAAETEQGMLSHREHELASGRRILVERINMLLHRAPELPLPPAPAELESGPPVDLDAGPLIARALASRPELAARSARVRAREAEVALAQREFLPDFTVRGGYQTTWQEEPLRPVVGVELNVPLQVGRRLAALDEADAMLAREQSRARALEDRIRFEVVSAVERLRESEHLLEISQQRRLPPARDRVVGSRAAFASGQIDVPRVRGRGAGAPGGRAGRVRGARGSLGAARRAGARARGDPRVRRSAAVTQQILSRRPAAAGRRARAHRVWRERDRDAAGRRARRTRRLRDLALHVSDAHVGTCDTPGKVSDLRHGPRGGYERPTRRAGPSGSTRSACRRSVCVSQKSSARRSCARFARSVVSPGTRRSSSTWRRRSAASCATCAPTRSGHGSRRATRCSRSTAPSSTPRRPSISRLGESASEALRLAARARLRLWDVADRDITALEERGAPLEALPVRAPVSGVLVEKNVVDGAAFEAGMRLFRIAPLDQVWVEAEVYAADLPLVAVGQTATITRALPRRDALEAQVAYVYPSLDERDAHRARSPRAAQRRTSRCDPDMFVDVALHADLGERAGRARFGRDRHGPAPARVRRPRRGPPRAAQGHDRRRERRAGRGARAASSRASASSRPGTSWSRPRAGSSRRWSSGERSRARGRRPDRARDRALCARNRG